MQPGESAIFLWIRKSLDQEVRIRRFDLGYVDEYSCHEAVSCPKRVRHACWIRRVEKYVEGPLYVQHVGTNWFSYVLK